VQRINIETEKKHKTLIKKTFSWLGKHIILTSLILMALVGYITYRYMVTGAEEKVMKIQAEEDRYKQEMFSEAHTKLQYHLEMEEPTEDSVEASARLIAHTMETGCSKSYKILLDNFTSESSEYLQDFLTARNCVEYKTPPVVKTASQEHSISYLVRLGNNNRRYIIKIRHNEYRVSAYEIKIYREKDKITEIEE